MTTSSKSCRSLLLLGLIANCLLIEEAVAQANHPLISARGGGGSRPASCGTVPAGSVIYINNVASCNNVAQSISGLLIALPNLLACTASLITLNLNLPLLSALGLVASGNGNPVTVQCCTSTSGSACSNSVSSCSSCNGGSCCCAIQC